MKRFGKVASALAAVVVTFVSSLAADAGIVRHPGSGSLVAPAMPGSTHLVSDTNGIGDPLPAVSTEYVFHDGSAPIVEVTYAGTTQCLWGLEECWGEYVPGETTFFEGAVWGGQETAILSYEWTIRNEDGDILFTFTDASPETTTGLFYQGGTDPANPCVGAFLYSDAVSCQHFWISLVLPTSLNLNEFYYAQWQATYTAPAGMHFATSNGGSGDEIVLVQSTLSGASHLFPIMRIAAVPEAPAAFLVLFGVAGIVGLRSRRRRRIRI